MLIPGPIPSGPTMPPSNPQPIPFLLPSKGEDFHGGIFKHCHIICSTAESIPHVYRLREYGRGFFVLGKWIIKDEREGKDQPSGTRALGERKMGDREREREREENRKGLETPRVIEGKTEERHAVRVLLKRSIMNIHLSLIHI